MSQVKYELVFKIIGLGHILYVNKSCKDNACFLLFYASQDSKNRGASDVYSAVTLTCPRKNTLFMNAMALHY
jgi:hypothetical protein